MRVLTRAGTCRLEAITRVGREPMGPASKGTSAERRYSRR